MSIAPSVGHTCSTVFGLCFFVELTGEPVNCVDDPE